MRLALAFVGILPTITLNLVAEGQSSGVPAPTSSSPAASAPQSGPATGPTSVPLAHDDQRVGYWEGHDWKWYDLKLDPARELRFRITIPAGHRYVTVVIEDPHGLRVRNLLGMAPVEKYGGDPASGKPQELTVPWNGLDDRAKPLPTGSYRVRGLSLPGLKATYEHSWYNPGDPPWEGYPNSGWGGDHVFPNALAFVPGRKWKMVFGGSTAEGGDGLFAVDAAGRKVWGFKRGWSGPNAMALVDGKLWAGLGGAFNNVKAITVFEIDTGKQLQEIPIENEAAAIAVGKDLVAVAIDKKKKVVFFDTSGKKLREVQLISPCIRNGLAFDREQRLYAASGKGLVCIARDGAVAPATLAGVENPGVMANDVQGNLYVLDRGADYQLKVLSPDLKVVRTIGEKGGQKSIDWNEKALREVTALAADGEGNVLIAEGVAPRRISLWSKDGRLVRDWVGNTNYGAWGGTMHDQDPTIGYIYSGMLIRLDPSKSPTYRPWRYISTGPKRVPEGTQTLPPPWGGWNHPSMFRSNASGQMREYFVSTVPYPVLYVSKNGDYRPIAAIGYAAGLSHCAALGPFFPPQKGNPKSLRLWTDLNDDEIGQPEEFQEISRQVAPQSIGWGHILANDLTWYVEGLELRPKRFTASGVPVYDTAAAKRLATPGTLFRVGDHLVGTQPGSTHEDAGYFFSGRYIFADLDGNRQATYRYNWPSVHGSMQGSIPRPGETCGELFMSGIVDAGKEIGHVFAMHGNMGQAFVFTEDGLFLSTLFKDCRQNPKGQGPTQERGADWTDVTMDQECFGGWFGKTSDGVTRYMFGRLACHVVRISGWEDVKRFDGGNVQLTGTAATSGPATAPAATARPLIVRNLAAAPPPKIDGDLSDWAGVPRRDIVSGDTVVATVAATHDGKNLFLSYEVIDDSPARNAAQDPLHHFKEGDLVDLMLGPAQPPRQQPVAGDLRLLIVPGKKPIAVLYRPVVTGTPEKDKVTFSSPVRSIQMDSVAALSDVEIAFKPGGKGYACEIRVPLKKLGVQYSAGMRMLGDLGVLFSNDGGKLTERRSYLFNQQTHVVKDIPSEAEILPGQFGSMVFE